SLWDLAQVVTLFMMTLLLALSAGHSFAASGPHLFVGRIDITTFSSVRNFLSQYLQRPSTKLWFPLRHHRSSYPGSLYTLLIALGCVNLDPTPRRRSYVGSGRPAIRALACGCCDHGSSGVQWVTARG